MEAKALHVNLPDDDVQTIESVLRFCYLQDYRQDDESLKLDPTEAVKEHLRVYLAADRLGITPLIDLAATRIIKWAQNGWSSKDFSGILQRIWSLVPPHQTILRDALVELLHQTLDTISLNQLERHSFWDVRISRSQYWSEKLKSMIKLLSI
ncbi:hypothetical protein BO82DRAFT_349394 [Aspergillus uvarum CBS 121591]|uniref:BTB domain-containing protein n=1 Tax=Aspergillus uvarum CBS 121591 TaxID=1448315 RepID=A0A319CIZ5_9EURO|nr:hypothetical protein BO82DRAFT_349394 [Aspergillus uvarum CBS 121591]PYH75378.1 hypothetical protein BO82DRAFT_349394 [Aspergillus uvarum CBS 121591]